MLDGEQHQIERFLQLGAQSDLRFDLRVAVRTYDLESALTQLLRAVVAHKERYVAPGFSEASPEVTSNGTRSND